MARSEVSVTFNMGWNIVRPPALISPGQLSRAENIDYTQNSVKRRLGKLRAYGYMVSVFNTPTLLKRFYRLAVTGTVNKYFYKAQDASTGSGIIRAASDWDDDSKTLITSGVNILSPRINNNSLYSDYDPGPAAWDLDTVKHAFSSKSWLYFYPEYSSTDDTDKVKHVGMRTKGPDTTDGYDDKMFLQGLVPPAQLRVADNTHDDSTPDSIKWSAEEILTTAGIMSNVVKAPDGRHFFAYKDSSTNNLSLAVRDTAGAWTQETVTGPVTPNALISGGSTIAVASDPLSNPSIVFVEDTTFDLRYAWRRQGVSTWDVETISVGSWESCAIAIGSDGKVHVVARSGGLELRYFAKTGGTWSAFEDVEIGGSLGEWLSIAVDSSNLPHVAYTESTQDDLKYHKRTGATASLWDGTPDFVDATNLKGRGCWIALDSNDAPHISYLEQISSPTEYRLRYAEKTSGSWVTEQVKASISTSGTVPYTHITLDPDDKPIIAYSDVVNSLTGLAMKEGGTWRTGNLPEQYSAGAQTSIISDTADSFEMLTKEGNDALWLTGTASIYYYRLTAEYDDLVLGESGPSAATRIVFNADMGIGGAGNILDLDVTDNHYDMTDEVTKINVYRTTRYGTASSTFYFVGSVSCTSGAPTSDFTDTSPDTTISGNKILDDDKFLPPKYKTATMWKDRLVIANLKARDTSATEGTELDLEENGIHKNRIRFSDAFHPDIFRANFFQDILPDGDSGSIQKLIVNPKIDTLFVFMERDVVALLDPLGDLVSSLSFRPRNIANSKGTPAPDSVVEYDGKIFYWTKYGIEVIDGFTGRNITSNTIGPLWHMLDTNHPRYADRINMSKLDLVRAIAVPKEEKIYWAYPAATQTYNDRVLVMDYARWRDTGFGDGVFSLYVGWNVSAFEVWDGEGDRGELFGGDAKAGANRPWIYRLNFGNFDEEGDFTGGSGQFYIGTSIYPGLSHFGRPDTLKSFRALRIDAHGATGDPEMRATIKLDVDSSDSPVTIDTNVSWAGGVNRVSRIGRTLPRTAVGLRAGIQIDTVDTVNSSPEPFEIYDIAFTLRDLPTRTRGIPT